MKREVTSYPLSWPRGYARTPVSERTWAQFRRTVNRPGQTWKSTEKLTVAEGVSRVMKSISAFTRAGRAWRINPNFVVVSTNLRTRMDGLPASGQKEPEDVGVAVYFELDGEAKVLCCDRWNKVADNLAAIAATLEAMRGLERWGVTEAERAFTGFAALPQASQQCTCWQVLGIEPTKNRDAIIQAWRTKAQTSHPDRPGGTHEAMTALNAAKEQALATLK